MENLTEINDSDWFNFKPIKIGLRLQNLKHSIFLLILRISHFLILLKIRHCAIFFPGYEHPRF